MQPGQLRMLRTKRELTQKELAKNLGVSHCIVSDWERGRRYPSRRNERKLVEYFGKPIDYLLPTDTPRPA